MQQYTGRLGPSLRIINNLGDLDHSFANLVTGESEQRLSGHYKDQWDAYYAGRGLPMQFTGGSMSIYSTYQTLREAGARARAMLLAAAAQHWQVDAATLRTENGRVYRGSKSVTYGSLADAAAQLPVPETVALKDQKDFRYLGKPQPRLDAPAMGDQRPPPVLPATVLAHRRRVRLARFVTGVTALLVLLAAGWQLGPYLRSTVVRDSAVTSWIHLAASPIVGQVDSHLPKAGDRVGADGRILTIRNAHSDPSAADMCARASVALAADI